MKTFSGRFLTFLLALLVSASAHGVTKTTNLQLNKPIVGERGYGPLLNENAQILDTAVGTNINADGSFKETGAILSGALQDGGIRGADIGSRVPGGKLHLIADSAVTFDEIDQQSIDVDCNAMSTNLIRAFKFDDDCEDYASNEDGTGTAIAYHSTFYYNPWGTNARGQCADFNATSSNVDIGSATDIDDLTEFTITFWTYCEGLGGGNEGHFLYKGANTLFKVINESGGYVGIYGKVGCTSTNAESQKNACLQKLTFHHVAITYSDSGDKTIRIYIDGTEVTGYDTQTAGVGARSADASETAYIGDVGDDSRVYDGKISTFLIYDAVLSSSRIKWLASEDTLVATVWEHAGYIDSTKQTHGMLCFEFHDGYSAVYSAAKPIFDNEGEVMDICIYVGAIGTSGRMTAAQIQEFVDDGHGLVSHSHRHGNPDNQTESQIRGELKYSKDHLENTFSTTVDHYAWPYGNPKESFRRIGADYYKSISSTAGPLGTYSAMYSIESAVIDSHGALATFKGLIDTAYSSNEVRIFLMHDVDSNDETTLQELIDYAQAKPIPIVTRSQLYDNLKFLPPEALHDHYSLKLANSGGAAELLYKSGTLDAVDYVLSFRAYTDGSVISATDILPFADTALTNEITSAYYVPQGDGIYSVWVTLTGTAATWNIGFAVGAGKTVYVGDFQCRKSTAPPRIALQPDQLLDYSGGRAPGTYSFGDDTLMVDGVLQRVGIKTANPSYELHVVGDTYVSGLSRLRRPTGEYGDSYPWASYLYGSATIASVYMNGTNDFVIDVSGYATAGMQFILPANEHFYVNLSGTGGVGIEDSTPDSTLEVGGSFATKTSTKTSNYTAAWSDCVLIGNPSGADITFTLPAASGITGRRYTLKCISATHDVIIDGDASETIDGAATKTLASQYAAIVIVCDGTNWIIESQMGTVN